MTGPVTRLRAYAGCPKARADSEGPAPLVENERGSIHVGTWRQLDAIEGRDASIWIAGLVGLMEAAATKPCDCLWANGGTGWVHCEACLNTGLVPDPHAILGVALHVAGECLSPDGMEFDAFEAADAALCAVEAYLKDPSDENMEAWCVAWGNASKTEWLPEPCALTRGRDYEMRKAADIVGLDPIRAAVLEEWPEETKT